MISFAEGIATLEAKVRVALLGQQVSCPLPHRLHPTSWGYFTSSTSRSLSFSFSQRHLSENYTSPERSSPQNEDFLDSKNREFRHYCVMVD